MNRFNKILLASTLTLALAACSKEEEEAPAPLSEKEINEAGLDIELQEGSPLIRFNNNTTVSGIEVINLIKEYRESGEPIAILVQSKYHQGLLRNFATKIEGVEGHEYDLTYVFGDDTNPTFPFNPSSDSPVESAAVQLNEFYQNNKTDDEQAVGRNAPSINFENPTLESISLSEWLYLSNELDSKGAVEDAPYDMIEDNARYISTLVLNSKEEILGVYFEEYGLDLEYAPLAYSMFSRYQLDIRKDYLGIEVPEDEEEFGQ